MPDHFFPLSKLSIDIPADPKLKIFQPITNVLKGRRVLFFDPIGSTSDFVASHATRQYFNDIGLKWREFAFWKKDYDTVVFRGGNHLNLLHDSRPFFQIYALKYPYGYDAHYRESIYQFVRRNNMDLIILPFTDPEPINPESIIAPIPDNAIKFVREAQTLERHPGAILAPEMSLYFNPTTVEYAKLPAISTKGYFLREDIELYSFSNKSQGDPAKLAADLPQYLELASTAEHIITDRLQFAIAAKAIGKRVTLLPSLSYKNKAIYDAWLSQSGIEWANDINDLEEEPSTQEVLHAKPI